MSATLLLCALAATGSAYTLVMRGGRRVEAPEKFWLTATTLTYESAPGLSVTLPLALLDVEATERENGEPRGTFYRHAVVQHEVGQRAGGAKGKARTMRPGAPVLTNRELEPARQARIESEEKYERRRRELGLPSLEEARRRAVRDAEELGAWGRQSAEETAEAEAFWRSRAGALRAETRALDAEIAYLNAVLDKRPEGFASGLAAGPVVALGNFVPFFHAPQAVPFTRAPVAGLAGVNFGALQTDGIGSIATAQIGAGLTLGGTIPRTAYGPGYSRPGGVFTRRHRGYAGVPSGYPISFDYGRADTTALLTRLRLLEAERAGLRERWRLLEEEARRAGAPPGWLRP